MLEKSIGLNVDCVCYDLEDSVTPGKKAAARSNIRRFLEQPRASGIKETAVRINAVSTGLALDDLTEVVCMAPIEFCYKITHGLIIMPCPAQSS
jgi:citrate lyase subunit beta-like protein